MRELEQLGDLAEPALRAALADHPSPEAGRRAQELLARPYSVRSSEALRRLRAVRVLEFIASDAARAVLHELAKGAPAAAETTEARHALGRLARKSARTGLP